MTVTVMINPSNFPFIDESRITEAVNEAVANGIDASTITTKAALEAIENGMHGTVRRYGIVCNGRH